MDTTQQQQTSLDIGSQRRWFLLGTLASGHAGMHWFQSAFWVLLAEMVTDLGLGPVAAGALSSVRSFAGGVVNLPSGFVSDTWANRRVLILVIGMAWIGLAYLGVGLAPTYALIVVAVALIGMGGAWWHPPAISTLSQRFPERRGFVLSIHGVGGSVGDILGPAMFGLLLGVLSWQASGQVVAGPAVLLAVLLWLALRSVMRDATGQRVSLGAYFAGVKEAARNIPLVLLVVISGLRAAAQVSLLTFFPIYLRDDLSFSSARVGFYVALIIALGIASQPVMGFLSDRFGRKFVLVPGLLAVGLMAPFITLVDTGWQLTLLVAVMGLFVYALSAIVLALGMDLAGEGLQATTVGVLFSSNFIFAGVAPLVAGALVAAFGIQAAFYFVGALFALPALAVAGLPIPRRAGAAADN